MPPTGCPVETHSLHLRAHEKIPLHSQEQCILYYVSTVFSGWNSSGSIPHFAVLCPRIHVFVLSRVFFNLCCQSCWLLLLLSCAFMPRKYLAAISAASVETSGDIQPLCLILWWIAPQLLIPSIKSKVKEGGGGGRKRRREELSTCYIFFSLSCFCEWWWKNQV